MVMDTLRLWREQGILSPLDEAFGKFIATQEPADTAPTALVAALLSAKLAEQHTCVALSRLNPGTSGETVFADTQALLACLTQAKTVSLAGDETPSTPMVLDNDRLYLQRYWWYETQLAARIRERLRSGFTLDVSAVQSLLSELFAANEADEIDWQKVAVSVAALSPFALITGGPGTGKTTTVTRLLALMQGLAGKAGRTLKIELVAPTGKAAARLSESLQRETARLPQGLQANLPATCSTIHRLLGSRMNRSEFEHNRRNPLHLDLLVVDEASMVDLPLMFKLIDALPPHARLVLLGDKDQLASVEAGSVLSDLCEAATNQDGFPRYGTERLRQLADIAGVTLDATGATEAGHAVGNALAVLHKSRRYSAQSGVGQLARAMNRGDTLKVKKILNDDSYPELRWYSTVLPAQMVADLMPGFASYFAAIRQGDMSKAFALLHSRQVLCAQRSGDWGVNRINQRIEGELARQGLIERGREFYPGRPVMISQNDHTLRLYNGDIGICLPDAENPGLMKVWFEQADGEYRGILPSRLPPHDTLYAMTIHKSQGSEFAEVLLCLPGSQEAGQLLSRELLYTGLTRAREQFSLFAEPAVLQRALGRRCERSSGLAERFNVD